MTTPKGNKWTYKVEPSRGYIPSDKVDFRGEPYETGFSTYFKKSIAMWGKNRPTYWENKNLGTTLIEEINKSVDKFCEEKCKTDDCKKIAMFYLNLNRDGIDVFIHRWAR